MAVKDGLGPSANGTRASVACGIPFVNELVLLILALATLMAWQLLGSVIE